MCVCVCACVRACARARAFRIVSTDKFLRFTNTFIIITIIIKMECTDIAFKQSLTKVEFHT